MEGAKIDIHATIAWQKAIEYPLKTKAPGHNSDDAGGIHE